MALRIYNLSEMRAALQSQGIITSNLEDYEVIRQYNLWLQSKRYEYQQETNRIWEYLNANKFKKSNK